MRRIGRSKRVSETDSSLSFIIFLSVYKHCRRADFFIKATRRGVSVQGHPREMYLPSDAGEMPAPMAGAHRRRQVQA